MANETSTTPPKKFNPLEKAIDVKNYTVSQNTGQPNGILPEPTFQPPNLSNNMPTPDGDKKSGGGSSDNGNNNSGGSGNGASTPASQKPFNPQLSNVPDAEKQQSAAQMAAYIMNLYKMAHGFGNSQLVISEDKINKMVMKGELDVMTPIPYDYGKFVPLGEFIQEYNNQSGETLVVTQEFEDAVMPALTRVLAKRGHGMTDEQFLLFMLSQDIGVKTFKFIQMKRQTRDILAFAREQSATRRVTPTVSMKQATSSSNDGNGAKVVQMETGQNQQQPQPVQQQPHPVEPIQDRLVRQFHESANGGVGVHVAAQDFGNPQRLHTMDDIYNQELKEKNKRKNTLKKLHPESTVVGMPKPSKKANITPIQPVKGKRGPGRPKGSTKKNGGKKK